MQRSLQYILKGIKPKTYEELATQAHDMELSNATSENQGLPVQEFCKGENKLNPRKGGKTYVKSEKKEAMAVVTTSVKFSTKPKKKEMSKTDYIQEKKKKTLTLKEMQEKEYPFPDSKDETH